ncbi:MAG: type II secretion system F family protein [Candidatus Bathyarchaeota archaeon]
MRALAVREFKEIFAESGITTPYDDYVRKIKLLAALAFLVTAILGFAFHHLTLQVINVRVVTAVLALSVASSCLASFVLLYYPLHQRNELREKVEDSLVYTLSYMTVLAAGGVSLEQIMERVSQIEENPTLNQLAKKFIIDAKLLGYDVTSALMDISFRSPSEALSMLFESIATTLQTSGDLKSLLSFEVQKQLQKKREKLEKTKGALVYMGELYVTLIVVTPILLILMLTILSALGGAPFGISTILQLNLMVFFGIPVFSLNLIILLDTMVKGEE